jgi:hypothetical protein
VRLVTGSLRPHQSDQKTALSRIGRVNNLDQLAEAKNEVLERVRERAASYETQRLQRAVRDYGNVRTKKFFDWVLKASPLNHAA